MPVISVVLQRLRQENRCKLGELIVKASLNYIMSCSLATVNRKIGSVNGTALHGKEECSCFYPG